MYPVSGVAAYDRAITLFSPDGEIYQVRYAGQAADNGSPALGMVYDDGVLFTADLRVLSRLVVAESVEKLFVIDDHVAVVSSGLIGDARALVEYARDVAVRHRFYYSEPVPVQTVAREVARVKQLYTQYGGVRPFGVAFLIGGYDETGPRLFETRPAGNMAEYLAQAIGKGKDKIMEVLEKEYSRDMKRKEAMELAVKALRAAIPGDEEVSAQRVVIAYVEKDMILKTVSKKEVEKLLGIK